MGRSQIDDVTGSDNTQGSTLLQQSSAAVIRMVITHLIDQLIRNLNPVVGSSVSIIDYFSFSMEEMIERLESEERLAWNGRM